MSNQYEQPRQWFPQQDPQRSPYEQPEWGQEYRQPEPVEYNAPQIQYDAPYERGYNPPWPGINYNEPYQFNPNQKISERRRSGISIFGIIRGLFYFLGVFIAAFGLFAIFDLTGEKSHIATGLGLFFMFGLIIAGLVFFFRLRGQVTRLHWPQFIGWLVGATVAAFMVSILDYTFFPDFSRGTGAFIFGCIVMFYGFALMAGAFW
ncbi:MAG TPA: hypothetical protein VFA41_19605 [Ktedonobacteraceae bacterium]|jgi:hypothetical protein|nr:hypothetical protein [Ktedonobacteraceae bacterium]